MDGFGILLELIFWVPEPVIRSRMSW